MHLNPTQPVRLARQYLERRYHTPITVDDVSREVALSPYHLIRVFKDTYNQTPYQYLVDLRIAKAKELLRNSDLSITDICASVGYNSLGSFSTLFRKATGVSPRTYRANSQPTPHPSYIPLCICLFHDLQEQPEL